MKTRKELLVELVAGLLMSPKQGTIRQHVEEAQELLTEIERACPEDEARSLEGHAFFKVQADCWRAEIADYALQLFNTTEGRAAAIHIREEIRRGGA